VQTPAVPALPSSRATTRGIESCGILAGTLSAGDSVFRVTTLIIPKQEGTSDTVSALNEEEIYEAQFSRWAVMSR
jgi:STAM-binding protein